ncbi:undecaprenyl-phosphate glucose phosphotransferase [Alicyclobacillus tolerans]|uniref:undecaprenyl-phosphate glucose phosphotransferase n=1 Tax=Alicyclobacillus tolerans TaxID=90970 RepID=UPI003B76764A
MFRTYQVFWNRMFQVIDACIVILSFFVAWRIKFDTGLLPYRGHEPLASFLPAILISLPLFWLANWIGGLYKPIRSRTFFQEGAALIRSLFFGMLFFMSLLYFLHLAQFSRAVLILFAVVYAALIVVERIAVRGALSLLRSRGFNKKFILLVGYTPATARFIEAMDAHPWFGYHVLGCVLPQGASFITREKPALPVLDSIDNLGNVLHEHLVDHVLISLSRQDVSYLPHVMSVCEAHGVQSLILPDYFDVLPARPRFETFAGMPLIDTRYVPLDDALNAMFKRVFDILFSVLVLVGLSPLYLAIALAVKLTSPGPILFKQERVGKNRRLFTMYKFRTMVVNPSVSSVVENVDGNHEVAVTQLEADLGWTVPNDSRRTALGKWLRKTSLDELPQFWNVLIGDMSVIGPRPERPQFVDKFKEEVPKYMVKHRVRPGITGWAQVNGWRGDTSIAERIKFDIDYIENWSLLLDFQIVWKTLTRGFVDENAY